MKNIFAPFNENDSLEGNLQSSKVQKGDTAMWKCPVCGESNSESSVFCTSCNKRREKQLQETQKYHSLQAADLESWAFGVWNASIAIAIITFIISGFTYTTDFELGFHFLSMFKGIVPAACFIIGGGVLRTIMNGLAVLVEAASRELTNKK